MIINISRPRGWVASVALVTAVVMLGVTAPLLASPAVKTNAISLTGVTGLGNNVAFAFNRYVFIAPYAPSPVDNEDDLSLYDNHYLYILDTKKANGAPVKVDLAWFDPSDSVTSRIFYPTNVIFEPNTSTLFVRGSRYVPTEDGYDRVEVIGYLHVNLDDNGKPVADQFIVPIDIQGVGTATCSDAPTEFATGQDGKYLVFTNGADIFTFSLSQGYIYRVEIVHPSEFDPVTNSISYLGVDPQTDIISVCWNHTITGEDGHTSTQSEISLYGLGADGTMPLLKRVLADTFADGAYLTPGSNITISSNPDKGTPDSAWFVTADGVLNQIDLKASSDDVLVQAKAVQSMPELSADGVDDPGPRVVSYDSSARTLVIVSRGYSAQISRPSNGRRGHISRPSNGHKMVEAAALAMVRVNKKNRVLSDAAITFQSDDGGGLSNAVVNANGQWLVSTYAGTLYSIGLQDDLTQVTPASLGAIGSRVEGLAFLDARQNVIGINSFEVDDTGVNIIDPGAVEIGKFFDSSAQAAGLTMSTQSSRATYGGGGGPVRQAQIRRPCNEKR